MPIENGDYVPRTTQALLDDETDEFKNKYPNGAVGQGSINLGLLYSVAATLNQNQEQALDETYDAAYIQTADGRELTWKCSSIGVERRDAQAATGVQKFSRSDAAPSDYTIPKGTVVQTAGTDPIKFETTEAVVLAKGTTSVKANAQAINGGEQTNLAQNSLTVMPSKPTGVESTTNPNATGDPSLTDTSGNALIPGLDRETDEELRERALSSTSIGGAASVRALDAALGNLDGVVSAGLNVNEKSTSNNGLDPYSSEVVVYGGDVKKIAETLFDTMEVIDLLRLQGGVHGTKATHTIHSDILNQDVTIPITRPTQVSLAVTLDVVTTSAYDGDTAVKKAIVDYIGGTAPDGSTVIGTGQGEDVIVDKFEAAVTSIEGVTGVASITVDSNADGTDDTTTNGAGLRVYAIADSEVATVDARNDITVN